MAEGETHPFEACAHCGNRFELGVDYPVTSRRESGDLVFYSFCDEECQRAWETTEDCATGDTSAGSASE